jgi:hypothetical protein
MNQRKQLGWGTVAALVGFALVSSGCDTREESLPEFEQRSSALAGLAGDTGCTWDSTDCNLCVNGVVSAFNNLRDHGEPLGFHPGGYELNLAYPSSDHLEGIQRLKSGEGRYFVVSKRDGRGAPFASVAHSVFMESRNTSGQRMRSNRLSHSASQPEDTWPSFSDRVVAGLGVQEDYLHGGGLQASGNLVALPMEEGSGKGKVMLYDYGDPSNPIWLGTVYGASNAAGTASLTKLSDGRFMLVIGQGDAKTLEFFLSSGMELTPATVWTPYDTWTQAEIPSGHWGAFQSLNFVTDCAEGRLYLIGTRLGGLRWGAVSDDYAHLYEVTLTPNVTIQSVASKHFYCSNDGSRQCNFDAAGGAFVDKDRNLLLYVTEHADDGPGGSVKMMEYRGIFPNAACGSDINQAFVDFYDDSNFSDRGFIFDFPDRSLKNWARFSEVDNFNDKVSAVRYCIPPGYRVRLYKDSNYSGSTKDLVGTGAPTSVNLNNWSFGDNTSAAQWLFY